MEIDENHSEMLYEQSNDENLFDQIEDKEESGTLSDTNEKKIGMVKQLHSCPFCEYKHKHKSGVKKHVGRKHPKKLKSYTLAQMNQSNKRDPYLKKEKKSHLCDQCSLTFEAKFRSMF